MDAADSVKKELEGLVGSQEALLELVKDTKNIIAFGTKYQEWYSRAYKIVQTLAPERLAEFVSYYMIDPKRKVLSAGNYVIQDYTTAMGARTDHYDRPLWDINNVIAIRILNQVQIIRAIASRVDSVIQDLTGHLFADLQDSELSAAAQLKKVNLRASGALAGVILERHLQRVATNHHVAPQKKNPTIADLNDPLKKAQVYDVLTWRRIQLLADIRNICSHQKSAEPTSGQVDELIDGVNTVIKTVF